MSQKIIFIDAITGIAQHFAEFTVPMFTHEQQLLDNTIAIIIQSIPDNIGEFIKTKYYKEGSFKELPKSPGEEYIWDLVKEVWEYSTILYENKIKLAKELVKTERDSLLYLSDWTDTVSASTRLENYNAWQFYRQQLRDITTQEGYPFNVIWPTQPV